MNSDTARRGLLSIIVCLATASARGLLLTYGIAQINCGEGTSAPQFFHAYASKPRVPADGKERLR
jgi:hypothetical protein